MFGETRVHIWSIKEYGNYWVTDNIWKKKKKKKEIVNEKHIILYVYSNTHYFKLDTYDYGNLAYSVIANKCNLANEFIVWETTYPGRQFKRNTIGLLS